MIKHQHYFRCGNCLKEFDTYMELVKHSKNHKKIKYRRLKFSKVTNPTTFLRCSYCGKEFDNYNEYTRHPISCKMKKSFKTIKVKHQSNNKKRPSFWKIYISSNP